ncbi:FmdB family zinc ribbon protein [Legionella sp. CNM-4043-24]|uniref:FmdB family zinc ribbon protein n=1 Tax=Legionella sp. CNM-4043-24 TaxID=3421646 RepID=UPI00403AB874
MPIYEYQCSTCHQQFDLLQKMSDAPATLCPNCQNHTAVRMVSAAGFQLKGSGWYVTDFKNKTNTSAGSSSDAPASKPSADKKD